MIWTLLHIGQPTLLFKSFSEAKTVQLKLKSVTSSIRRIEGGCRRWRFYFGFEDNWSEGRVYQPQLIGRKLAGKTMIIVLNYPLFSIPWEWVRICTICTQLHIYKDLARHMCTPPQLSWLPPQLHLCVPLPSVHLHIQPSSIGHRTAYKFSFFHTSRSLKRTFAIPPWPTIIRHKCTF